MMKYKHLFFGSLFSLMLISNQTKAFWPVFDMGEIVPTIKGVVESGKQLKTVQQSLADLKKSLETLKASVASLASFAAILGFDPSAIDEFMTSINDKISENLDRIANIEDEINSKMSEIAQGQVDCIESAIDEIENITTDVENLTNDVEQMADKVNDTKTDKPLELKIPEDIEPKEPIKLETPEGLLIKDTPLKLEVIEEEEEEEEIDDNEQLSKAKQVIALTEAEIEKSHIMLNDYLDVAINKLSENHKITSAQIDEIQKRVDSSADIADDKKAQISEELEIIKEENDQLYSKIIASAESKKYSYNREYDAKIKEGFNNYEKIVEAYIYGDISKDRFLNSGKEFKKKVNSVVLSLKGNNNQEFALASTSIKDKLKEVSNKIINMGDKSKAN